MNTAEKKPKFSIVVTARNDDYGGNWVNRINAFIKMLVHYSTVYKTYVELVFVEYNPVPHKKNLWQELTVEDSEYLTARFIIVPHEFHLTLPDHEKVTVCEFIAKNIGIRRASADFIIAANPDILFSKKLFEYLATTEFDPHSFYRINRRDLQVNHFDSARTAPEIEKIAEHDVVLIHYNITTVYISYKAWFNRFIHGRTLKSFLLCPFFNRWKTISTDEHTIHENAAGDFMLTSREGWYRVGGYDQMTVGSGVLDGYVLYLLYCYGYQQKIIPFALYHINHHHKGVKYLASHEKFRNDAREMLETKKPYKINSEQWGYPDWDFKEVYLPNHRP